MGHFLCVNSIVSGAAWPILQVPEYIKNFETYTSTIETTADWKIKCLVCFPFELSMIRLGSTPVVVLFSTHLRYAWSAIPDENTGDNSIGQFIRAIHKLSEEERDRVPPNPDHDSLYTPWRDSIYHM